MADNLPTVWPADAHTIAKHAILESYLNGWMPILARQSQRFERGRGGNRWEEVLFVDAFAGPGEYSGGQPGSPVIALRSAANHLVRFPIPVRLVFNEFRVDRYEHLQGVIAREESTLLDTSNVVLEPVHNDDSNDVVSLLLERAESHGRVFGPALVFLDQFGFSAVPMETVRRIMLRGVPVARFSWHEPLDW